MPRKDLGILDNTGLDEFSVAIGNEPIKLSELIQRFNNIFNDASKDI